MWQILTQGKIEIVDDPGVVKRFAAEVFGGVSGHRRSLLKHWRIPVPERDFRPHFRLKVGVLGLLLNHQLLLVRAGQRSPGREVDPDSGSSGGGFRGPGEPGRVDGRGASVQAQHFEDKFWKFRTKMKDDLDFGDELKLLEHVRMRRCRELD